MMKNLFVALLVVLLLIPCAAAYGVTFYNPAWNPQDGKIFDVVEPDKPYVFDVKNEDIAITKITFTISREAQNGGITVYNLQTIPESLPEVPENDSYEFNELKYSGFVPHDTKEFLYEFKVAKGWLENYSVPRNTISLHAYNRIQEVWEALPTKIIGEDGSFVQYSGEVTGVHYLLVGKSQSGQVAEQLVELEEEKPKEKVEEKQEPLAGDIDMSSEVTPVQLGERAPSPQPAPSAQPVPQPAPGSDDEDGFKFLGALILLVVIVLGLIIYLVFGKKTIGSTVDRELNNYIRESLKRGKAKEDVRNRLLDVGWHPERIDKALARHKGVAVEAAKEAAKESVKSGEPVKSGSIAQAKAIAAQQKKLSAPRKRPVAKKVKSKKK
jgi:PGF-pre-PGF domain-containing protein